MFFQAKVSAPCPSPSQEGPEKVWRSIVANYPTQALGHGTESAQISEEPIHVVR